MFFASMLLLSGCARDESSRVAGAAAEHTASDTEQEKLNEENLAKYMELFAEELKPVVTEEESKELEQMDWDETIRPYMMYDWIHDTRIEKMMEKAFSVSLYLQSVFLRTVMEICIISIQPGNGQTGKIN